MGLSVSNDNLKRIDIRGSSSLTRYDGRVTYRSDCGTNFVISHRHAVFERGYEITAATDVQGCGERPCFKRVPDPLYRLTDSPSGAVVTEDKSQNINEAT